MDALKYAKEYDCDYFYITPDTQYEGAWNVTEILTLFVFDVDARYYQGVTNFWNGKEISYWDRFRYSNPPEDQYITDESTAYIFKSSAQNLFPQERFYVTVFGDYAVAIPWSVIYG